MNSTCLVLDPRESGKFIAKSAKNVFIEKEGIIRVAHKILESLKTGELSINNFSQHVYHPEKVDKKAADWLFLIDTLNFSFWTDENMRWKVNGESGYFALCAAIKRAIESEIPITDATFISKITYEELKSILQGDEGCAEIPLINERVKNLNDVGRVLCEKYNGTFENCIKSSERSARKLLALIVRDFECFRDEAFYNNRKVSFYKRAQILVGDIWACFQGKGLGEFHDIEYITMFADYRVPQVLLHFGAMRYSDQLTNKLLSNEQLEPGCAEEIEIRGCSIEVVEGIVEEVKNLIEAHSSLELSKRDCNSILVDHFLWDYRRKHVEELDKKPYHKTRTIFY